MPAASGSAKTETLFVNSLISVLQSTKAEMYVQNLHHAFMCDCYRSCSLVGIIVSYIRVIVLFKSTSQSDGSSSVHTTQLC